MHKKPRQIIEFSLSPKLAAEVKMEAARQGLSLKNLFEEIWMIYQKEIAKKGRHASKSR